ncbi:hypothetical protein Plhal304r1_c065g0153371 [Plasmopara halstedii]
MRVRAPEGVSTAYFEATLALKQSIIISGHWATKYAIHLVFMTSICYQVS